MLRGVVSVLLETRVDARMARYGLLKVTDLLACKRTIWGTLGDVQLRRPVPYQGSAGVPVLSLGPRAGWVFLWCV